MADPSQIGAWSEAYKTHKPAFERLASEVEFALLSNTKQNGIKTHSVTSRVKSIESIAEKAKRKELDDPLSEIEDTVGIRVVALFLSDLPRLDEMIRDSFEIHSADDKIEGGDPASFGYMSVHYIASLDDQHSGPRYDDLKGIPFEIQTRTVVMDAWANVSHYLDYKGESSVPEELRRDFFALSGLFYVADQHFEMFAGRARQSQARAAEGLDSGAGDRVEINLDTLEAFLEQRYPDRKHGDRPGVSELVEEMAKAGVVDLKTLADALDTGDAAFLKYEKEHPPDRFRSGDGRFTDVGAARLTLAIADPDFGASYARRPKLRPFLQWK